VRYSIILSSCSLLVFLAGCSTERITDYQPASPSISERAVQQSGVEVALDPFVDRERTDKYFKIDAVAEGIAILHVRLQNKTADKTFLVEKKDFHLFPEGSAGGAMGDDKKIERSQTAGTTVEVIGAVTLAGVDALYLAGLASVSQSTEVQRNFTAKEMADATLPPGKSMEGFIYFTPVKEGVDWTRTAAVKINLTETITRQVIELNIPLSH
jgi:hypothetical protein